MAGYVEKQVAAYQKTVADAIAGKQLKAAIKQLQDKSQIRDSLKTLPARGAITAKRSIGKRTGTTAGDYTEMSRNFHTTLRELRSSDGLFVLQYYNVKQIVMDKATFNYLDYAP
jgi:hypothetical protein